MNLLKRFFYIMVASLMALPFSCDNDDEFYVIEGLDFTIATLNAEGNRAGVLPATSVPDNRIVYTVDFGNPNDDADVFQTSGPLVTYDYPLETATYQITVTASLPGRDDVSITKEHTVVYITDPDPTPASGVVGTWRFAPEAGAMGVGPALNDTSWWANSEADVTTRACLFDDTYVFNMDGTFQNVQGADTWVEAWQGNDPEGCAAPVAPHDGSAAASYVHDAGAGTITINGTGAFLGLAKAINGAELASPGDAPESVTYLATLSENDTVLELDIEIAGGGYWSFKLVKDAPPAPSALEGTWRFAPEAGAMGVGPGLNDTSWWANSAADVTTRACLFDDTYVFNTDGSFQNIQGTDTWVEAWQGNDPEGCAAPVAPHDGTASATYTYDEGAGTITLNGVGAYLGLAKAINGAELTSPGDAPSSVTYLADLSADGNTLELDIEIAGGGYWSFKLVKDVVPSGVQGTWKFAPEAGAMGVGPGLNDTSWWANSAADVTTRACLFDDTYVFNTDGSFQNVQGSDTWVEAWQGNDPEGCAAPVAPHDGSGSATYTYDAGAGTITLNGTGAYLGLAKAINGAELTSPGDAPSSVTYLADLSADGNTLELDIEIAGGGYWSFKLVRQ